MTTQTQKRISLITAIVLLLLSALLFVAALFPIATFKYPQMQPSKAFSEGRYTKDLVVADSHFALKDILVAVRHAGAFLTVVRVQGYDEDLAELEEEILAETNQSEKLALRAERENILMERDILLTKAEDDPEKLENALMSESFVHALSFYYSFGALPENLASTDALGEELPAVATWNGFLRVIGFVCYLSICISTLIFVVFSFCSFFKRMYAVMKNHKSFGELELAEFRTPSLRRYCRFTVLPLLLLNLIYAGGIVFGWGVILFLIVYPLYSLLCALPEMVFTNKSRPAHIFRRAIALISAGACVLFLVGFCQIQLIGSFRTEKDDFIKTYAAAEYERKVKILEEEGLSLSYTEIAEAEEEAMEAAESAASKHYTFRILFSAISVGIAYLMLCRAFRRFHPCARTAAQSELPAKTLLHGPALVISLLVVASSLITGVFGVDKLSTREVSYKSGDMPILWNAHEIAETPQNEMKGKIEGAILEADAELRQANQKLSLASSEQAKNEAQKEVWRAEATLQALENGMDMIAPNQSGFRLLTTVSAIVLFCSESIYFLVGKVWVKKEQNP